MLIKREDDFMVYLIILAIAGFLMFPAHEWFQQIGFIGDLLTLAMGLGIGRCMCGLSDNDFGFFKLLAQACIFIALVGYLGFWGWLIAIAIGFFW